MVLLKNEGNLLPLRADVRRIAVIGGEAWWRDAPQGHISVGGGGSGSVKAPHVSAPLDSILARLGAAENKTCTSHGFKARSPCTWNLPGDTAGQVLYDYGADFEQAAATAAAADITIIFVKTISGEGHDRNSLLLDSIPYHDPKNDGSSESLIARVTKASKHVIVVMVTPGVVLTPWRNEVSSIVAAFLPGQEYGGAITDLLWGDVGPTARLPMTFPTSDNDLGFSQEQYPGIPKEDVRVEKTGWRTDTTYSEKLEVGYRYYDAHSVEPAFPFGHGLSYTQFKYTNIHASKESVSFTVTNVGDRDGAEMVQLYLGFPASAGEPPKQLKGFKKVVATKGSSMTVTLPLSKRSLSIWDVQSHRWQEQAGKFTAMVGASSRDIRLTASFETGNSVPIVI
jgi:beta-glucosidase